MTISTKELKNIRREMVKSMHQHIINMGDEEIYEAWIILGIPDEPSEEDFALFEEPEDFRELCDLFGRLTREEWED